MNAWNKDFYDLALFWAKRRSKDPSTQVGAVIADDRNHIISIGYNGFPSGVHDCPDLLNDRPSKYARVVHAEPNAILQAGERARGAKMICTLFPCNECTKLIIQAGIKYLIAPAPDMSREAAQYDVSLDMLARAGVITEFIE